MDSPRPYQLPPVPAPPAQVSSIPQHGPVSPQPYGPTPYQPPTDPTESNTNVNHQKIEPHSTVKIETEIKTIPPQHNQAEEQLMQLLDSNVQQHQEMTNQEVGSVATTTVTINHVLEPSSTDNVASTTITHKTNSILLEDTNQDDQGRNFTLSDLTSVNVETEESKKTPSMQTEESPRGITLDAKIRSSMMMTTTKAKSGSFKFFTPPGDYMQQTISSSSFVVEQSDQTSGGREKTGLTTPNIDIVQDILHKVVNEVVESKLRNILQNQTKSPETDSSSKSKVSNTSTTTTDKSSQEGKKLKSKEKKKAEKRKWKKKIKKKTNKQLKKNVKNILKILKNHLPTTNISDGKSKSKKLATSKKDSEDARSKRKDARPPVIDLHGKHAAATVKIIPPTISSSTTRKKAAHGVTPTTPKSSTKVDKVALFFKTSKALSGVTGASVESRGRTLEETDSSEEITDDGRSNEIIDDFKISDDTVDKLKKNQTSRETSGRSDYSFKDYINSIQSDYSNEAIDFE